MTQEQRKLLDALGGATYAPATFSKRFAREMAARPDDYELTAKQEACCWRLAYTFRRQMPRDIAEEAIRRKVSHRCTTKDQNGWFVCEICGGHLSSRHLNNPCPGPPAPKPIKARKKRAAEQPAVITTESQEDLF